jgi:hypothetical protein
VRRRTRSLFDRFWAKVDTSAGPDACHPWTGAVSKRLYGTIQTGGRGTPLIKAHRFALVLATGIEPDDKEACHAPTCTTSLCCNQRHLRWGTRTENEHDKRHKRSDRELIAAAIANVFGAGNEYADVVAD